MTLFLAVFLVTLSGLMFEVGLTRIFSAALWYHFAFLAISVALLGWGLGGFAVHLLRLRLTPAPATAARLTLLYAASIPITVWTIVRLPAASGLLGIYFLLAVVPFSLAGMALSMLFTLHRRRAGHLYFADLAGASLGALTVTLLLSRLGAENAMLAVAVAPAAAAALLHRPLAPTAIAGAVMLSTGVLLDWGPALFAIRHAPGKGLYQHIAEAPGARIARTGWNAYSRIDAVVGIPDTAHVARLYIDSDAWTNVPAWDGRLESLDGVPDWYRALPFAVAPASPRTLVIGSGGGADVLVALAAGSQRVTAVEMNPLMLEFARAFGPDAGHLYDHPRVEAVLEEGRTFVRRSRQPFDVIVLGFVDSWAAVASGGLSLSENHLYTVEAFQAYAERLSDAGVLAILRWEADAPRLVANAFALLGADAATRRVAVVMAAQGRGGDPPQMAFLLKKTPFTPDERRRLATRPGTRAVVVPGWHVERPYAPLFDGRMSLEAWLRQWPTLVDPVHDDRPFFFARHRPLGLPAAMAAGIAGLVVPVVALCAALLRAGRPAAGGRRYASSAMYFAALGVGFIAVELSLLQHLTLLLGHPTFTLSVLLFTLLAAGGLGSAWAGRPPVARVCLVVAALATAYALTLGRVVPALLPLPEPARILLAMGLVAPLGFVMGIPFPRGLAHTGQGPLPPPPFYWGLNGVCSVLGSVATMLLAVTAGFTWAMLAGAGCYLVAAAASRAFDEA